MHMWFTSAGRAIFHEICSGRRRLSPEMRASIRNCRVSIKKHARWNMARQHSGCGIEEKQTHDDTLSAGTFFAESQFVEPKCAHTPSLETEGRQGRVVMVAGLRWARVSCLFQSSLNSKRTAGTSIESHCLGLRLGAVLSTFVGIVSLAIVIFKRPLTDAPVCGYCSASTVLFDGVPSENDSPFEFLEMSRKLGVFEMAEVHEECEMNRSSVHLRLLNHF